MTRTLLGFCVSVVLLAFACPVLPQACCKRKEPAYYKKAGRRLPITMADGLPLIKLSINGSKPVPFLIDSGSQNTLLSQEMLSQLSIPTNIRKDLQVIGASGNYNDSPRQADGVTLITNRRVFMSGSFTVVNLKALCIQLKTELGGIVGFDYLSQKAFVLDLPNRLFLAFDPVHFVIPSGLQKMPGSCGITPLVNAEVRFEGGQGRKAQFLLDTGNSESLILSKAFKDDAHISVADNKSKKTAMGITGEYSMTGGIQVELVAGELHLTIPDANISEASTGTLGLRKGLDGSLGLPTFATGSILFDCPAGILGFVP